MTFKTITLTCALLAVTLARAAPVEATVEPVKSYIRVQVSASPPHQFTCELTGFDLELRLDPEAHSISASTLTFPFEKLVSGNAKRDRKMNKWMEVAQHPDIQFKLDNIAQTAEGTRAQGMLRMHGVEQAIEFPCEWKAAQGVFSIDGHYTLDHRQWGLPKIRLLVFTVKPELEISFHLEGTYASAG